MSDVITQLTERESIVTEMKYLYLLCLICQNPLIKVTVIRSVQTNLFVINFVFCATIILNQCTKTKVDEGHSRKKSFGLRDFLQLLISSCKIGRKGS